MDDQPHDHRATSPSRRKRAGGRAPHAVAKAPSETPPNAAPVAHQERHRAAQTESAMLETLELLPDELTIRIDRADLAGPAR